jgi:hypothetical protein
MADTNEQFIGDPTNHLVGVIDARPDAEAAKRDLDGAGFDEVHVYYGGDGAETIDSTGSEHGAGSQLLRGIQQLFSNKDNLAEYEEAASEGRTVLAIKIQDDDRRDEAAGILERYSAHNVNYFGQAVVRTIKP